MTMNRAEQLRHCGQRGCPCTHGMGMGQEATCDKGWIDMPDRIVRELRTVDGEQRVVEVHYPVMAPCFTCTPARAEAVALANAHGTSIHDALVEAART